MGYNLTNIPYRDIYEGNTINALSTKSDLSDFVTKYFYMIQIQNEKGKRYILFPVIFESFQLAKSEKVQIMESFNEVTHLYAFGKSPDRLQLSGHILASSAFNYAHLMGNVALTNYYENILRAFKVADSGLRAKITGPNISGKGSTLIVGVAINMTISMSANLESVIGFSMDFIASDTVSGVSNILTIKPKAPTIKAT